MIYCLKCGSRRVQVLEWRDANTDEYRGESAGEYTWCEDCETHPLLTDDRREAARARLEKRRERRGYCRACGLRNATPARPDGLCSECFACENATT